MELSGKFKIYPVGKINQLKIKKRKLVRFTKLRFLIF